MSESASRIAPLTFTITAAAKRMGVARCTLSALVRDGKIAYVLIGSAKRIPESAIHEFLIRSRIELKSEPVAPLTEAEIAQFVRRLNGLRSTEKKK